MEGVPIFQAQQEIYPPRGDPYGNLPLYLRDLGNAWLLQPHCSPECLSSLEYPSRQPGSGQMRRNEAQSQGFEDYYWYLELERSPHSILVQKVHVR